MLEKRQIFRVMVLVKLRIIHFDIKKERDWKLFEGRKIDGNERKKNRTNREIFFFIFLDVSKTNERKFVSFTFLSSAHPVAKEKIINGKNDFRDFPFNWCAFFSIFTFFLLLPIYSNVDSWTSPNGSFFIFSSLHVTHLPTHPHVHVVDISHRVANRCLFSSLFVSLNLP